MNCWDSSSAKESEEMRYALCFENRISCLLDVKKELSTVYEYQELS